MKKEAIRKKRLLTLMAAAALCPVWSAGQTVRGDVDYDGKFTVSDLTTLIQYLLNGNQWDRIPEGIAHETVTANGVSFEMIKVEGGSYSNGDGSYTTVGDFWIGQTEVTQQLWNAVMGTAPSRTPYSPARDVSWDACQTFITTLNELTGRQFRLPSSPEWCYAARGGKRSQGYPYAGSDNPKLVANYRDTPWANQPMNVGSLAPNELCLYDMSGNVSEWCNDSPGGGRNPYYRGGDYYWGADHCLLTWSATYNAAMHVPMIGLRLAM